MVAGSLIAGSMRRLTDARLERTLVSQARLAVDLVANAGRLEPGADVGVLDAEARRVGQLLDAHVTFISGEGRIVGDSAEPAATLTTLENQLFRPEIAAAAAIGLGRARAYSAAAGATMFYVATPATHPDIAFVRVGLPLTESREQLQTRS